MFATAKTDIYIADNLFFAGFNCKNNLKRKATLNYLKFD